MPEFKAIAAMSENRVIGVKNTIPWHLPEDFKWFRKVTTGNIVVMGRKTFESLGRPLTNRRTLILTHHPRRLIDRHPEIFGKYKEWRGGQQLKVAYQLRFTKIGGNENDDILIFNSLSKLNPSEFPVQIFICGGAEVYSQSLPDCSDLYLTRVKRVVDGDAYFPPFEHMFQQESVLTETPEFQIEHWRNTHRNAGS